MLFAIRETHNESLGIFPFEVLFDKKVRGPLRLVKDKLINFYSHKLVTVNNYLDNSKSTLLQVRSFACNNIKQAKHIMKAWFDITAPVRTLKEGDLVLAFIPVPGYPL